MKNHPTRKNNLLYVLLSWLYGLVVYIRNKLFDIRILRQSTYDIPIICVGNITAGGTGKTPHIEYLIQFLSSRYRVAVLSRGYKRKKKGFIVVNESDTAEDVGDEPLQIKQKYPDTLVVVDKNRRSAIRKILAFSEEKKPNVILLDDGFQHRYVQPSLSILLVDSNRPIFEDRLLPAGRLREPINAKNRAGMVIVTKCAESMQPIDYRIFSNTLDLYPYQSLFFTTLDYGMLQPVFKDFDLQELSLSDLRKIHILLIAGIANPKPLEEKLNKYTYNLYTSYFPDHHFFTKKDISAIQKQFNEIPDDDKIIVTTEKDAVRLRASSFLGNEIKQSIYYIPIEVAFIYKEDKKLFKQKINKHVKSYQEHHRLSKRSNQGHS